MYISYNSCFSSVRYVYTFTPETIFHVFADLKSVLMQEGQLLSGSIISCDCRFEVSSF